MYDNLLMPSIDNRIGGLIEVSRRLKAEKNKLGRETAPLTVTISREFGCEAYPAAEALQEILEQMTGQRWALIDRSLIDEIAKLHDLEAELLHNLGRRPRWLDDMLASISATWKSERDYFQLLAQKIVALAAGGNVIIVGMGAAIVTQSMKNCRHIRIFASQEFKTESIRKRAGISAAEAVEMIERRQKAREKFVRDFLNRDINDIHHFHLLLNNDKCTARQLAETMASFLSITAGKPAPGGDGS
jgi:cytidylate kinase